MGVIKFLRDISGLFNWNTDDNPTSELTYMNAVKNWQETEKNLVDTVLWQPTTAYAVGNMVKTPSLPSQYCLVCTTAGTSGANEPSYSGKTIGSSVSDGSVTWVVKEYFPVPTYVGINKTTINITNNTAFTAGTVSLPKGTWMAYVTVYFTGNTNIGGLREVTLHPGTSSTPESYIEVYSSYLPTTGSGSIRTAGTCVFTLSSQQNVPIIIFQNSGQTLNNSWFMARFVRISDNVLF
jgi:hypothetical protein